VQGRKVHKFNPEGQKVRNLYYIPDLLMPIL